MKLTKVKFRHLPLVICSVVCNKKENMNENLTYNTKIQIFQRIGFMQSRKASVTFTVMFTLSVIGA